MIEPSPERLLQACDWALRAPTLRDFRSAVISQLGGELPFDAALFHELSPRAPLEHAALLGLDEALLRDSSRHWDDTAVALGRLRDVAMGQAGAATDREAFPRASSMHREWQRRIAKPFGIDSMLILHLVVDCRIVAALILFRRGAQGFSSAERQWLACWGNILSVCDAFWQGRAQQPQPGLVTELRCRDQRLTVRQREIVEHVALGHTNRQIALALRLSENTVRNVLVQVRQRLGAANRADIVRLAVLR